MLDLAELHIEFEIAFDMEISEKVTEKIPALCDAVNLKEKYRDKAMEHSW